MKLLIVSSTEKSLRDFKDVLSLNRTLVPTTVTSLAAAREVYENTDIDIVLINAPLSDGDGVAFAKEITEGGNSQVIMIVPVGTKTASLEEYGIFTVGRPISANMFWTAIRLASATQARLKSLSRETRKLRENIENIKIVDRAKCCLIQYLDMSEEQAHKYIEKQAMDNRVTKREIAEDILKTYEN